MRDAAPAVFSIPAGVSFVDALARGLMARFGEDPVRLAGLTVLLPTRRACRGLREALLRASLGRALLLPRLLPLGDLDADELLLAADEPPLAAMDGAVDGAMDGIELPPAVPGLRRQLLLARLVEHWGRAQGDFGPAQVPTEDQAVRLAEELARLIDQVETEGLSFDRLAGLVPEDYAAHWQITLRFLRIITEQWPAIQAEEGCLGPAERRRRLLEAQAAAWRRSPPTDPVIVAGSTGSIPATAALIETVARLPRGVVVLPGLDRSADDDTWAAIADDPTHPQHGLALLLARLEMARPAVEDWPGAPLEATAAARSRFINAALRPASATVGWRALGTGPEGAQLARAVGGVRRIDCPGSGEEALVIALLLRETLETPGRTAALVTPDRALARRVAAELRRWGIEVDDSAGVPLGDTAPGTFLRLSAEMVAVALAPVPLLSALKHPLAAGGLSVGVFRARVRALEMAVLRGPRPAPGFRGLRRAVEALEPDPGRDELIAWLDGLERAAAAFVAALDDPRADLSAIVAGHVAFAEALAATDRAPGAERLWSGDAGEAAAGFIADLNQASAAGPPLKGERYPALLGSLMAGHVVRPRYGRHPRLAILGPLEARLQHADRMILAGLNEGTWPGEVAPGAWLSRPMRADFGLPPPERRIGLAAHDFAQAFSAPEVFLTRAQRVEGTPTVPSRWLLRIDALLQAMGLAGVLEAGGQSWQAWVGELDRPARPERIGPPAPTPPLAARPRRLSVTKIETWMRDPYALYAAEILKLRALDPIDADPGLAERGILVHRALERFIRAFPEALPDDPLAALLEQGSAVFDRVRSRPGLWAFWWPRFERIARWFATREAERRARIVRAWAEVRGELALAGPAGPFILHAKADRIDLLPDGGLAIIDYKTGGLPNPKDVALGFAPQLPLEAALAQRGGFGPEVPAGAPTDLEFWRLSGGEPPGEIKAVGPDAAELAAAAFEGLTRLIAAFDDPARPYHAVPRPGWAPRYSDYDHLARVKEWSAGGGAEDRE